MIKKRMDNVLGKEKLTFTDNDRIEKGEHYLNFEGLNLKRLNPFNDMDSISLDDIINFEEKGIFLEQDDDIEKREKLKELVSSCIEGLPEEERCIIKLFYFEGYDLKDVSTSMGHNINYVTNMKVKAENKLKSALNKILYYKKADPNCLLCNYENSQELDSFIFDWLDNHNWYFVGILTAIKEKFSFKTLTTSQFKSHLEFHMGVEKHAVNDDFSLDYLDKDDKKQVIHIVVTSKLKLALDELSDRYDIKSTDLIRQCLKVGLKNLQVILEMNDDLQNLQLQFLRKVTKVKEI